MSEVETWTESSRYKDDFWKLKYNWLLAIVKYRLLPPDAQALLTYFFQKSKVLNRVVECTYTDIGRSLNFVTTSPNPEKGEYVNRGKVGRALKYLIDLQLVLQAKTGRGSVYVLVMIDLDDLINRIQSLSKGSFRHEKVPTKYIVTVHHVFRQMGASSFPQVDFSDVENLARAMGRGDKVSLSPDDKDSLSSDVSLSLSSDDKESGAPEARKPHEQGGDAQSLHYSLKNSFLLSEISEFLDAEIISDAKRKNMNLELEKLVCAYGADKVLDAFRDLQARPEGRRPQPPALFSYMAPVLEASKKNHAKELAREKRSKLLQNFKATLTKAVGENSLHRPDFDPEIESFIKVDAFPIEGEWKALRNNNGRSSIDTVSNYFNQRMARRQDYFIAKEAK